MGRAKKAAIVAACFLAVVAHGTLVMVLIAPRLVISAHEAALIAKAQSDLENIATAARFFRSDHGRWPKSVAELESVAALPDGSSSGPYLVGPALDPWTGVPYSMRRGPHGGPELISLGADGATGGVGENSDIVVVVHLRAGQE